MYRVLGEYDSANYFYNKCLELDANNRKALFGKTEIDNILKKRN